MNQSATDHIGLHGADGTMKFQKQWNKQQNSSVLRKINSTRLKVTSLKEVAMIIWLLPSNTNQKLSKNKAWWEMSGVSKTILKPHVKFKFLDWRTLVIRSSGGLKHTSELEMKMVLLSSNSSIHKSPIENSSQAASVLKPETFIWETISTGDLDAELQ